jgi:hypothetical protein
VKKALYLGLERNCDAFRSSYSHDSVVCVSYIFYPNIIGIGYVGFNRFSPVHQFLRHPPGGGGAAPPPGGCTRGLLEKCFNFFRVVTFSSVLGFRFETSYLA